MPARDKEYCISCNVRAYRVAHLLDTDGDYEQARAVISLGTARWGGLFSIAVPVSGGSIAPGWWDLLRWYDPDIMHIQAPDYPDLSEPTDQGVLPFHVLSTASMHWDVESNPLMYSARSPLSQLAVYETETITSAAPLADWRVIHTEAAPYRDFLEASVGMPPSVMPMDDFAHLELTHIEVNQTEMPWPLAKEQMLSSQLHHTRWHLRGAVGRTRSGFPPRPLLVVSEQANVPDFCCFWSARAIYLGWASVHWVPLAIVRNNTRDVQHWLAANCMQFAAGKPHFLITSMTVAQDELERTAAVLSNDTMAASVSSVDDILCHTPDAADLSTPSQIQKQGLVSGSTRVLTPQPGLRFPHPRGNLGRWAVDIEVEHNDPAKPGLHYPRSVGLADQMIRGECWEQYRYAPETEARVLRDGTLSVGVTGYNSVIAVNALEAAAVAVHTLTVPRFDAAPRNMNYDPDRTTVRMEAYARAYRKVTRSEKGVAAAHVASLLQSWEDMKQLLAWQERLQYLVGNSRSTKQFAGKFAPDDAEPDDAEFKRVLRMTDDWMIPFLVERRMLLQGYYLRCQHCNSCAWYPLDDVGQDYQCSRCLQMNRTGPHPEYSYQLAPLVERAISKHQLLPLAATALLAREAKNDFFWQPETLMAEPVDPDWSNTDIDIFCVRDGGLIIGEAAQEGGFSQTDMRNLRRFASVLRPSEIVFAVMRRQLTQSDQERIGQLQADVEQFGTEVCIFLKHHLLQSDRDAQPRRQFLGNPRTRKVHRISCRYARGIRPPLERFETYNEAAANGYRACTECQPDQR